MEFKVDEIVNAGRGMTADTSHDRRVRECSLGSVVPRRMSDPRSNMSP